MAGITKKNIETELISRYQNTLLAGYKKKSAQGAILFEKISADKLWQDWIFVNMSSRYGFTITAGVVMERRFTQIEDYAKSLTDKYFTDAPDSSYPTIRSTKNFRDYKVNDDIQIESAADLETFLTAFELYVEKEGGAFYTDEASFKALYNRIKTCGLDYVSLYKKSGLINRDLQSVLIVYLAGDDYYKELMEYLLGYLHQEITDMGGYNTVTDIARLKFIASVKALQDLKTAIDAGELKKYQEQYVKLLNS